MEKVRFTIRINKELDSEIERKAKKDGVAKSYLITQALWQFVERHNQKNRQHN